MNPERDPAPRASTPAIDRLLERLRRRLVALVWMHGLSTAVAATAAWVAVAFLVDWTLHVPSGVRWFHLLVLAVVPSVFLLRELVRPLRRLPSRAELAVLVERAHPDLHELFVSAVDLARAPAGSGAPELVADVLRKAEARADTLPLDGVLDPRGPRRRFALGAASSLACLALLATNAEAAGIFLDRLFGGNRPWPRRTHLVVEIPLAGAMQPSELSECQPEPAELKAKVARGQDVPLLVRAEGVVPDEVVLHFKGGERAVLASSGGPAFRTLLRSLQEDTEFFVTGGDDTDEVPWVRLQVLQPPDVEALAIAVTPPEYSGLPPRVEYDRDVEVLQGSRLVVHVLPTPRNATGKARFLPEDRVLELAPVPFPDPAPDPSASGAAPAAARAGLACEFVAEKSARFRFELLDATGLANPDPGLFAITVVEDRAPEVEVLAPSRTEFDTIPGGLLALRARAEDDFGLVAMSWSANAAGEDAGGAAPAARTLEWRALTEDELRSSEEQDAPRARAARATGLGAARLEVAELFAGAPVTEGQQFQLVVAARDNAAPTAHEGRASAVRVRVVSPDEFARRLQDRLARVQALVNALAELQRDKSRRTAELLAVLESDQLEGRDREAEIGLVATGQRRAQGDAKNLARELCSVCESVLYSRLDDRGGALLEFLDARLATSVRKNFDAEPWRELAAAAARGELGKGALSSKLVEITGLALEVSEDDTRRAVDALARAQQETELAAVHARLQEAASHETVALEKLDRLLEMLAEWDNFQSVLVLTRDLLNGQKNLQERTRASFKEK
ncbi:MAG: hypothetical protein IPJ77_03360 [Planctomycetes bacterium]|nr:hypothetical protein [Planctomycetota bacterium]